MGAYIIRRLLLVFPTLLGILIINFALVQFVPGGPVEQILAQIKARVTFSKLFLGVAEKLAIIMMDLMQEPGDYLMNLLKSSKKSLALTNRQLSAFLTCFGII